MTALTETGVPCAHRWQIEAPNGTPFVMGRCARCYEERTFRASMPTSLAPIRKVMQAEQAMREARKHGVSL